MNIFSQNEMTVRDQSVGADWGQSKCINENIIPKMSSGYELDVKTGTEILDDIYLPKQEIISGILPRGTYLLGGASKTGKSFMVLQLAYQISEGIPVWGQSVRKGPVLYLALEDHEKRLQSRMCRMFGAENVDNVYFATRSATISGGLEDQIKDFLNQHPDTSLVIIDTLQKVRDYDRGSYADDYAVISAVKNITDVRDLAIILGKKKDELIEKLSALIPEMDRFHSEVEKVSEHISYLSESLHDANRAYRHARDELYDERQAAGEDKVTIRKLERQVREQDKLLRKIPPEIIAEIRRKEREKDWER